MKRWLGLDSFFLFFLRKLLFLWVRTHLLPQDFAQLGIDRNKPVVYVLQDRSLSNLLVVNNETMCQGLPAASAPARHKGAGADRSFFCLNRNDGFFFGRYRMPYVSGRLGRLVHALHLHPDEDVQVVPVSVYWGRSPDRENSLFRLMFADNWSAAGLIKKFFMIMANGRQTYVQFATPVSLRALIDEDLGEERTVRKLARVLRVHFRREREAMIGPDLSHRRTLVDTLIAAPAVKEAIARDAADNKRTPEESTEAAWEYANEIAADYSHTVIRFLEMVLTWLWNRLYAGVDIGRVDRLASVARTHEVVYVPCHRSHIDYLLLSYVIYRHGMVPPHIAAGINLNMPVVGPILRRGGAFFMRRSFKGNPLYATVFNEYVHSMFARGFSVEYFIEGGRSRTGRLLPPRAGMLAMTLRSFLRAPERPIAFVPVYIGYERILESGSYVEELHGKKKKKETLGGFFETVARLFGRAEKLSDRFGKVHLNFGDPLDLQVFLDGERPGWREPATGSEEDHDWMVPVVDRLAVEINRRINDAADVNPINLLSLALLSTPKRVMDEASLRAQLDLYLRLLREAPYSAETTVTAMGAAEMIAYGEKMQLLQRRRHPLGDLLWLDDAASVTMTYYRNNVLHLFAVPSLVANLVLQNRELSPAQLESIAALVNVPLRSELFLHHDRHRIGERIREVVDALVGAGLIERTAAGNLRAPGVNSLEYVQLATLAQAVRETLERYYIVISLLTTHGSGVLTEPELERITQLVAQRNAMLYAFNSPEYFDAAVIRNFIRTLKRVGLFSANADGRIEFTEQLRSIEHDTRRILPAEIRNNIAQHTQLDLDALPAPDEGRAKKR
jgi:glycerol-3-phosphate O-acyltransferase